MSTFREIYQSDTFAIPGYPGYYYRPIDRSVVTNKTNEKYRTGKLLKKYSTTKGEEYIYALDYTNCRRKLTFTKIQELLNDEIHRNIQFQQNSFTNVNQESQQINRYMQIEQNRNYNNMCIPYINTYSDKVVLDINGDVVQQLLKPLIVFLF
ncbi:MAG: hypothetical protein M0P49_02965 [Bacilli bacterium]|nr:hypothetical protein [Bacilli bacterium]